MNDRKIITLIVLANDNIVYRVGDGVLNTITKIIDITKEYQDCIYCAYEVYVGDKVISRIENCPVVVEYEI